MHKEANFIKWDFCDRSYVNDETVAVAAAAAAAESPPIERADP